MTLAVDLSGKRFTRQRFTGTGLTGKYFRGDPEAGAMARWPAAAASLQLSGTTHAEKERMLSERQVELRRSNPREPVGFIPEWRERLSACRRQWQACAGMYKS